MSTPYSRQPRQPRQVRQVRQSQQARQTRQLRAQLDALKRDDEMLYHVLAVDVWALAKTMDEFQPGFWAAFMKNRDKALKRFLEEMIKRRTAATRASDHPFYH